MHIRRFLVECSSRSFTDVEYSRTGAVIRGRERAVPKSKYEEDGE